MDATTQGPYQAGDWGLGPRIRARAKREWAKRDLRKWAMMAMLADEADTIREVG